MKEPIPKCISLYVYAIICMLCLSISFVNYADTGSNTGIDVQTVESDISEVKADTNKTEYRRVSQHVVFDAAVEVDPALDYKCPYEISKCVATMEHKMGNDHLTTWDIYLINCGLIGTWIVNESGNDITFYGDVYLYDLDKDIVNLGSCFTDGENVFYEGHLCVFPDTFQESKGFMVETFPWGDIETPDPLDIKRPLLPLN